MSIVEAASQAAAPGLPGPAPVDDALARARAALWRLQRDDGAWWAELESNVTITAEVLLLHRIWGTWDRVAHREAERYLRAEQRAHGGWDLAYGDGGELSTTVEAYLALRLLDVPASDPALLRARDFIRARGGIARARVFTKFHLALVGAYDWRGLPALPPWILLIPPGMKPFSIYELSSWARGSTVPLTVVFDRKPVYGPRVDLDELYCEEDDDSRFAPVGAGSPLGHFFSGVDAVLRAMERAGFVPFREAGIRAAERWTVERQEATGDWGGIIPAMLNAMLMLRVLGYALDDPVVARGFDAIDAFTIRDGEGWRVQPCVSPVWDTALAVRALVDAGERPDDPRLVRAVSWLLDKQIVSVYGDWSVKNRRGKPGGWAFEFDNAWYPDVDDTAMVVMALAAVEHPDAARVDGAIRRAADWVASMQCRGGGWGAFDVDNDLAFLNEIPYGDLRAMIDPPTADVTARVVEMVTRGGARLEGARVARGIEALLAEQEDDGAWYGRWGVNYVYGTSGALVALERAPRTPSIDAAAQRGAVWLRAVQNADGGWGETTESYRDPALRGIGPSTASQTAWGVLGLLAVVARHPALADDFDPAIERGVAWLLARQQADGGWDEPQFTGTGFPVHFYLNYHQYRLHFPVSALGRYAAWRRAATPDVVG